jgi:predicted transposase/invertase (TIGR01784 family)
MAREVISAKLDVVFKTLFVKHPDLLKSFIADILDININDIEEIIITNPELPPETIDGKFSRLDLNLKLQDKLINIEIQINSQEDYSDRVLFYWAKLFTSDLKSGDEYGQLQQAISINIVNFNMFDGKDFHNEVVPVIKGTDKVFSDKMNIHFFELPKVSRNLNKNNRKELWMQFIKADSEEEFEMLKNTNVAEIVNATNVILDMSEDTRMRELARWREKAAHDRASALGSAKREGIAIGRAEGKDEGIKAMIENMRLSGMTDEQIEKIVNIKKDK